MAVTVYGPPANAFAVNVGAVACPCEVVITSPSTTPPANVPLAPVPGAVNVTVMPLAGLPLLVTPATSGANAEPVVALEACHSLLPSKGAPPPQKMPLTTPLGPRIRDYSDGHVS